MNTEPTKPAQEEEEDSRVRQIVDLGSSVVTNDHGTVHCLTVIGQIEGHGRPLPAPRPPNMNTFCLCWPPSRSLRRWTACWCCCTPWAAMWRRGWPSQR